MVLAAAIQVSEASFVRFQYCREYPGNNENEKQCVDVNASGSGNSLRKRRGGEETLTPLTLSSAAKEKALSLIAATRNLADRQKYESRQKVANLGRKQLILELASEKREAEFNYSDLKEVNALTTFFDAILNQQNVILDLETATQYERLSVPDRLNHLENELKLGRIGDPPGLIPILDRIIGDERVLTYAREQAQRLKSQVIVRSR
jgi:hypothetical protein